MNQFDRIITKLGMTFFDFMATRTMTRGLRKGGVPVSTATLVEAFRGVHELMLEQETDDPKLRDKSLMYLEALIAKTEAKLDHPTF